MSYKKYLSGLKDSLVIFRKANRVGANLSRYEAFDYMFKTELAVSEGMKKDVPFFKKKMMFIESVDYRIACFYAMFFSRLMNMKKGYSFKTVKSLFKDILNYARNNCICSEKFNIEFKDCNNELITTVYSKGSYYDYEISCYNDLVSSVLDLVSLLGSMDEKLDFNMDWFNGYLYKVYDCVCSGESAKPYVDSESFSITFKKFISEDVKTKGKDIVRCNKEKKVVNFYN